jgi:catechol 2,3-dioxygenase-like lactoylglutathione lyase family enzyme
MKRLHVHVAVADLGQSVRFYSTLFGTDPSVQKPDYAKWMLEDPRVNFAISTRGRKPGVNHLGIQVESREELAEITDRLKAAQHTTEDEAAATCCYAQSSKTWSEDPQGISWETFFTFGSATVYGEGGERQDDMLVMGNLSQPKGGDACCRPEDAGKPGCCA